MTKGRAGRTTVLLTAIALTLSACAWGQAGGNAARNGANPYEPTLTMDNVGALQLAWQANSASLSGVGPVMDGKYVYTTNSNSYVQAYAVGGPASAQGAPHCTGSPSICTPVWVARLSPFAPLSAPVVDGERVFASANVDGKWTLFALDADPQDCPDTINGCEPLWSARWGGPIRQQGTHSVVVVDGRVYVSTPPEANGVTHLAAFDARGITGCSAGPPRTCNPLFQIESPMASDFAPSMAIAEGRLFVQSTDATLVFDAAGQSGCTNGVCVPLYRLASGSAPGVSLYGTTAFAAVDRTLQAFDATGTNGCTGNPRVCQPKWSAPLGNRSSLDLPTVSNGRVLVALSSPDPAGIQLEVFDAAGVQGCAGSPLVCQPIWGVTRAEMPGLASHVAATPTLAIVSGWSILPNPPLTLTQTLKTFDLAGTRSCSGTPKRCTAVATTVVGSDQGISGPAIAFGRVALTDDSGHLRVFALPGS